MIKAEVQQLLYSSMDMALRYSLFQDVSQRREQTSTKLGLLGHGKITFQLKKERQLLVSSSAQRKCSAFNGVFATITEKNIHE